MQCRLYLVIDDGRIYRFNGNAPCLLEDEVALYGVAVILSTIFRKVLSGYLLNPLSVSLHTNSPIYALKYRLRIVCADHRNHSAPGLRAALWRYAIQTQRLVRCDD